MRFIKTLKSLTYNEPKTRAKYYCFQKNFEEAKMPQRYIHKNGTSKLDKRCKQYKSQKKAAGIAKRTRKKK